MRNPRKPNIRNARSKCHLDAGSEVSLDGRFLGVLYRHACRRSRVVHFRRGHVLRSLDQHRHRVWTPFFHRWPTVIDKLADHPVVQPPPVADRQRQRQGTDRLQPASVWEVKAAEDAVLQRNLLRFHIRGGGRRTHGDHSHQRRLAWRSVVPDRRESVELDKRALVVSEPAAVGGGLAASKGLGGRAGFVGLDDGRSVTGRRVGHGCVRRGRKRHRGGPTLGAKVRGDVVPRRY